MTKPKVIEASHGQALFEILLGAQSIAATAVAVERVVLRDNDPDAVAAFESILQDEQEHHDQSALHLERPELLDRALGAIVSAATELVIWIGMRV